MQVALPVVQSAQQRPLVTLLPLQLSNQGIAPQAMEPRSFEALPLAPILARAGWLALDLIYHYPSATNKDFSQQPSSYKPFSAQSTLKLLPSEPLTAAPDIAFAYAFAQSLGLRS